MVGFALFYAFGGAVAGLFAGLLGIGGGLIVVPLMACILPHEGVPAPLVMHVALGTSMASIIFTTISSTISHNRRGAVNWPLAGRIVLGILVGSYLGSLLASHLPSDLLKGVFAVFLCFAAARMLLGSSAKAARPLPGKTGLLGAGGIIGTISSMVGIGGGTLSVPYFAWNSVPMHEAIGTSAALGLPLALAGTIGYVANGLHESGLPAHSLGYVDLPALAAIVCLSVVTAPLGARMAHALPVGRLRKIFAVLLLFLAVRMIVSIF
ncbi:protein of unknown function DUF81 [Desulfovibrio sp. X2]|uniref:sulfite exporter TauE/SafE family protein n=1 Tax=Desulfovibrio sp. X2 TaxID=941449 RepID=UPI000358E29E|nr:sulfite exporter TauE/SafE family protein [Desulfovibrio sp. X2]EPR42783.1 protein of unknown function DUF81 [Desulfovibrio sp. X2]